LPETLTIDDVRRILSNLPGSVFIIDEFDRAANVTSREFTDLLKSLSDFAVDCTTAPLFWLGFPTRLISWFWTMPPLAGVSSRYNCRE